jgi:hypothetical protein
LARNLGVRGASVIATRRDLFRRTDSKKQRSRGCATPGADDFGVTIVDFANAWADATFRLAYLVRNTIIEVMVSRGGDGFPELQRLPPGKAIRAFAETPTHLGFEEYDVATPISFSHPYWVVYGLAIPPPPPRASVRVLVVSRLRIADVR